jgi:plastocyanin
MSSVRQFALLLSLLTAAGCASNPSPGQGTKAARVHVDNQAAYDMDVTVLANGDPVRLGFAPAKQVTQFELAAGMLAGARTIRFEAHPSLGGQAVISDPFTVQPGDELTWVIPPQ